MHVGRGRGWGGGEAQQTQLAMFLVLRRKGGRHPSSGFYPIFALSVLTSSNSFWLRANFRSRAGQGCDRATEFFETATKKIIFTKRGGNFKEFVLLIEGSRYPLQLRWRPLAAAEAGAATPGAAGMPVRWPRRPAAVSEAVAAGAGPDFSCAAGKSGPPSHRSAR